MNMKSSAKRFFIQNIVTFFGLAIAIRFLTIFLPSFEVDMNAWLGWASRMVSVGPSKFYTDAVWTQYTPGMLYYLWFIGKLGLASEFVIKATILLADIATALVIRKIVGDKNKLVGDLAFLFYLLNPVVIFTGTVWGQVDSLLALALLASAYFGLNHKSYIAGVLWGLSFLIKPQAFVFVFPALFIGVVRKYKIREYLEFSLPAFITIFLLSLPFFPKDPLFGVYHLAEKMTAYYNYTSVFAFNFWSIVGMWIHDSQTFLGITYQIWGIILFILMSSAIFWRFKGEVGKDKYAYLVFGLIFLASFLFPTRVHERYMFPAFAFLVVATFKARSKILLGLLTLLTILNLINLYHPYAYYSHNFLRSESLLNFTGSVHAFVAVVTIAIFLALLSFYKSGSKFDFEKLMQKQTNGADDTRKKNFPKLNLGGWKVGQILLLILTFSFFTRVFALSSPTHEYFDEVYHAFTARRMLHNDPHAWDWSGTAPEGFAYEWTHPPVAKFGMMAGMTIFGENSFGWRIVGAILGVVSVYLIYLIAKKLFEDEGVGLISAGIFSLAGIPLVMSRIAMNDTYLLVFSLASIYFFLKEKNILSAIFFGLALASKWSAVWLFPIIIFGYILYRKKPKVSYLAYFIIPPIIYLASYAPFFLEGRSFDQFFNIDTFLMCLGKSTCNLPYGLQQQMLWYHTHLNATHAYTSAWWSWPLNLRPVYLYTSPEDISGAVSRIYLIGNPLFAWSALAIVAYLLSKRLFGDKNLKFLFFGYLIFFVPWALSPRIMFLYHYLPSIPFAAMICGYFLRKYPKFLPITFSLLIVSFVYFYPHWIGLKVPGWLDSSYYWFSSWR